VDGTISEEEFIRWFADESIRAYFSALQLECNNPKAFFRLLDSTGTGALDSDAFVKGCLTLTGTAGRLEVAELSRRTKYLQSVLEQEFGSLKFGASDRIRWNNGEARLAAEITVKI